MTKMADGRKHKAVEAATDNFSMNTRSGRYGAAYNMVGLRCFNEELLLLPKNPTESIMAVHTLVRALQPFQQES